MRPRAHPGLWVVLALAGCSLSETRASLLWDGAADVGVPGELGAAVQPADLASPDESHKAKHCPPACASCVAGVCVLSCDNGCTCPVGWTCSVECKGAGCRGPIDCSRAGHCFINCSNGPCIPSP